MAEYSLPPAANWFASSAIAASPSATGCVAYASQNQVVIVDVPEVEQNRSAEENWRQPSASPVPYPRSYVINDAHEDRTKICGVCWCPVREGGPGQQNLLTTADDGSVRVWKWSRESYSLVSKHSIHSETRSKVFGLDWSSVDPSLVVTADEAGCFVSWDLRTNRTRKLYYGKNCVFSLALHPEDVDLVGFGCKHGLVFIASLSGTGRTIHKMRGHDEDVYSVSWCPKPTDSNIWRLVSSSRDKTLRVWSQTEGKSGVTLKLPQQGGGRGKGFQQQAYITCKWLDEHRILSSGEGGDLLLWNISAIKDKKEHVKPDVLHREHSRSLFSICSINGLVYSTGQDRIIPAYNLNSRRLVYSLPTLNGFVYCMASNPLDPSILAVGVGDGLARIWRTGSGSSLFDVTHVKLNQSKVMSLAWHGTREGLLALGTDEGRVGWLDAFSNKPQTTYSSYQHRGGVYSITWGPSLTEDGTEAKLLYSVGDGKMVQHNTKTKESTDLTSLLSPSSSSSINVSQALWHYVEERLLLCLGLDDGTVNFYWIPGPKLFMSLNCHKKLIQSLAMHPSYLSTGAQAVHRNWLATASNEFNIHLWNMNEPQKETDEPVILVTPTASLEGHYQRVIELAWNPHRDGQLVSVSYDCSAQIWDVDTLAPIHNFQGHSKRVMSCLWHPTQADLVMTGGEDLTLAVWKPENQQQSKPVDRKKKRPKHQPTQTPQVDTKPDSELSFEELLEKHRREREAGASRPSPPTEQASPQDLVQDRPAGPGSSSESRRKKRAASTRRLLFPTATKTEAGSSAPTDCLDIARFRQGRREEEEGKGEVGALCNGLNKLELGSTENRNEESRTDQVEAGAGARAYLGFFYGKGGMERLLKTETEKSEDLSTRAVHSLWTGSLADALKAAEAAGSLTESMVAQSAGISQRVWRETCTAFANQLSKEGEAVRSSEYYLAVHLVAEAIQVLKRAEEYKAALAIAVSRLPDQDPVIQELMSSWACKSIQDGNLPLAAKCWTAAGYPEKAADSLAKLGTRDGLQAAAVLSVDPQRSQVYARQCLTDCIFNLDTKLGYALVRSCPAAVSWGGILILLYTNLDHVTKQVSIADGDGLLIQMQKEMVDLDLSCDRSRLPELDQFVRTTSSGDRSRSRLLKVAGHLAQATLHAANGDTQLSLEQISMALSVLHSCPDQLFRVVKAVFPKGTQPPEAGRALNKLTPLDWQCRWPQLRSIQCSEALALLHSKSTVWDEEMMLDVADAFMQEDVLLAQKLGAEIAEGEHALTTFNPDQEEAEPDVAEDASAAQCTTLDLTPSLTGPQTVNLGEAATTAAAVTEENSGGGCGGHVPLPPGIENLPAPAPQPSLSFYHRFLKGRKDSKEAMKELQKLKWMLSKQDALLLPYPDLSLCCKDLLQVLLEKGLGQSQAEETEELKEARDQGKDLPFTKKLARFGYYKGARLHQEYFLQHS